MWVLCVFPPSSVDFRRWSRREELLTCTQAKACCKWTLIVFLELTLRSDTGC